MVAGNWKMHGSLESVKSLLSALSSKQLSDLPCEVVICPPALYVATVIEQCDKSIAVGTQNVSEFEQGAFTGEWLVDMVKDVGCKFAIVGHSERRTVFGETSEQVAIKAEKLLKQAITPIVCIGETLEQREAGETMNVVENQLEAVLKVVGQQQFAQLVLAYEPVWAIGTGKTASPEQAQNVHAEIRGWMQRNDVDAQQVRILYGGSVKADNAKELFAQEDIDGGLIGGASLKADDFYQICKSAG